MAISFLQDIVVNNQITVGTSASASSGNRLDITTSSIGFHSNGTDVGNIFNSGVNFFINSGASGGTVIFGAPATYTQNIDVYGEVEAKTLVLTNIANANTDTDKFLVLDSSGNVDFRTGAQVRSDIGAGTGSGSMSSWTLTADSGGNETVTNGESVDIAGGTNISTARSGSTVTITNGITNNNQLTNGAGYVTSSGVTSVATGTGLTGGTITSTGTLSLATAGAGSGTYGSTSNSTKIDTITLDAYGRVTAVATGSTGSGSGTVTSVATGNGLTGGTITSSGTISMTGSYTGNFGATGTIAGTQGLFTDNGNGQNVRIGDDVWIGDINVANTMRISGNQDSTKGFITFGSSSGTTLGRSGTGPLIWGGDFTVSGDLTVSGGDIILGGTGRIQGIDTVSSGTDAANKTYVDNQISGVPQGTVTSVAVSAGSGISISGSPITSSGTITVTNSAPDQTVGLSGGTGISVSGTYPNFTITNTSPSSGGTMSSWNLQGDSGGSTSITNGETVDIAGGTNISTSRSSNTITITNGITNNNQLTNGAGYVTSSGVTSVATGNGISGGTITSTGTLTVGAGNGLSQSSTGLLMSGSYSGSFTVFGSTLSLTNSSGYAALEVGGTSGAFLDLKKPASDDYDIRLIHTTAGSNELTTASGDLKINTNNTLALTLNNNAITFPAGIIFGASATTIQEVTLNENTRFTFDPQPGGSSYQGDVIKLFTSSTNAGEVYALSNLAAFWGQADADTSQAINMLAIATSTSSGNGMLLKGIFRKASHGLSAGRPIYLSQTAGGMTNTAPSASGTYVRVIGYAIDSNTIYFNPDNTWVQNVSP